MEKIKAQICFNADSNLEVVEKQLRELAENENLVFYSCFLPRHIVKEKGFGTEVIDLIDNILGDRHTYVCKDAETFKSLMSNLSTYREQTADMVNRMYVLDSKEASGIQDEIMLFTNRKVIMM